MKSLQYLPVTITLCNNNTENQLFPLATYKRKYILIGVVVMDAVSQNVFATKCFHDPYNTCKWGIKSTDEWLNNNIDLNFMSPTIPKLTSFVTPKYAGETCGTYNSACHFGGVRLTLRICTHIYTLVFAICCGSFIDGTTPPRQGNYHAGAICN